jgi:hypothetical protein
LVHSALRRHSAALARYSFALLISRGIRHSPQGKAVTGPISGPRIRQSSSSRDHLCSPPCLRSSKMQKARGRRGHRSATPPRKSILAIESPGVEQISRHLVPPRSFRWGGPVAVARAVARVNLLRWGGIFGGSAIGPLRASVAYSAPLGLFP